MPGHRAKGRDGSVGERKKESTRHASLNPELHSWSLIGKQRDREKGQREMGGGGEEGGREGGGRLEERKREGEKEGERGGDRGGREGERDRIIN